jgi:hypothetical protein
VAGDGLRYAVLGSAFKNTLYMQVRRASNGYGIVKGKAIPLQASTGPEGSRRLRLPDFKTIGT